jgi:hypothetical protein
MEEHLATKHMKIAGQTMLQNLIESVDSQSGSGDPSNLHNGRVPLTVSFDMGWQKKGRSFDSLSGHALIICVATGKVIGLKVYSKTCIKCSGYSSEGLLPCNYPSHDCSKITMGHPRGWRPVRP